ncbi:hypothetical protein AB1I66_18940, partial [[Clostridium] symbiosum]
DKSTISCGYTDDNVWINDRKLRFIFRLWINLKLSLLISAVLHNDFYRDKPLCSGPVRAFTQIHTPYYECYGIYI